MAVEAELLRSIQDLGQRLTRAEETILAGDPRVTEALETARQALSSAASGTATAADLQTAIKTLERELQAVAARAPKVRSLSAGDPPVPDPESVDNPGVPADPGTSQPPAPPAPPSSTSAAPPSVTQRKRRRF